MNHRPALVLSVLALFLVAVLLGAACLPGMPAPTAALPSDSVAGLDAVDQAWKILFQDYVDKSKLDPKELSRGAIKGMLEALDDPYTAYLDPHVYEMELRGLEGKYQGIGAYVGYREGQVVVISAIPGSPAEKAGIQAGDRIQEVDGQATSGLSLTEVVLRIRGTAGTTVTLLILHEGSANPVLVAITRAEIKLRTVNWEMKGDIAYVRVSHFSEPTAGEFDSAVAGIIDSQARGVVLDLRSNPGGLLGSVVEVASHFVSEGVVVYVVDREGKRFELRASPHKGQVNLPMVVLVDEFSASGSEVLAGALRDRGVAKLAGVKTFGKGSVNIFRPLPDGGALYITTSRWQTPNGTTIEGQGLQPDFQSDLTGSDLVNWAVDYLHQQAVGKASLDAVLAGA